MDMFTILLMVIAILPELFIGYYVYTKDRRKEPASLLMLLFCMGVMIALAIMTVSRVTLELGINPINTSKLTKLELLIYSLISVGLVEEGLKWCATYFIGYKNKFFDETYDIVIYAVFVALGFAGFENLLYVLQYNQLDTAISRALLSVPGHAAWAIFMGYYMCLGKLDRMQGFFEQERFHLFLSILIPTVFHGIYDFLAFSQNEFLAVLMLAFSFLLFIFAFIKLRESYIENKTFIIKLKQCKNCGFKHRFNVCPNCGARQE